jgi:2-dehydro-3-deoxygalactonokinase
VIGVDWGTSHVRAFLLPDDGTPGILDRRQSDDGVRCVEPGQFEGALRELIAPWLAQGQRRILLSGMVGSRQGWVETRPVPCPARLDDLAAALGQVPFAGACVRLVPGVTAADASNVPEIMRGEETQILGSGVGTGFVCLPGSHSKWASVDRATITGFATYFTGEAFAALGAHTLLARLMRPDAPPAEPAFDDGVARSAEPGGLLHHLFGVRSLGLAGRLAESDAASYLSGLLIGHEARAALPVATGEIVVVGAAPLAARYVRAIAACGGRARLGEADAAARGLALIGARVAWTS